MVAALSALAFISRGETEGGDESLGVRVQLVSSKDPLLEVCMYESGASVGLLLENVTVGIRWHTAMLCN